MSTDIHHLITHSGWFHADDACAAGLLKRLYPHAEIVRTRDLKEIEDLSKTGIVFDVGWRHEPEARWFDHHQPGAPERRDGTRYSAVGLVWQHYGRAWLESRGTDPAHIVSLWEALDREMILPIDLVDNGHLSPSSLGVAQHLSLHAIIDSLNPNFEEDPSLADARFLQATALMGLAMENRTRVLEAGLRAEKLVHQELAAQWGDPVLFLPRKMPFQAAVRAAGADHVLFVVAPSPSGGWGIEGMPLEVGSYTLRRDLPEAWAGLAGPDLERASGVEGARFCHQGRFFAVGETAEAAASMARLALQDDPSPTL